jgi:predicted GH43/DUF377 family glycosyl hydrolase
VIALGLATACAPIQSQLGAPLQDLADPPAFPLFDRHPAQTPAISSGKAGLPVMIFDPQVYADDEGYHLFYTTTFCRRPYSFAYTWDPANPYRCNIVHTVGSIGYAFSSDRGLSWQFRETPVVMPGLSGFDAAKIETAHVFRIDDTLYLSYSADGDASGRKLASRYQIGIAKLELGKRSLREALLEGSASFERRSEPLLAYSLEEGSLHNNVQEPSIIVRDGRIELYYVGLGLKLPREAIDAPGQVITSVALGRANFDLDLVPICAPEDGLLIGANITEVKYFDGAYHLFATAFSDGEFHRGEQITYATSQDGRHWSAPQLLLSPGELPVFDNWGLMAPTVVPEDDRVILFYTAYGAEPHQCFPVPADGRFGMPVDGGTQCLSATLGRAVSKRLPAE